MKTYTLWLTACLFLLISCSKIPKDDVEPYKGRNYFPVNTGHELVYDVEKITINSAIDLWDTVHFQLKERITGSFTDSLGRQTQILERSVKNDTTAGEFDPYQTWYSCLLTSTGHRVENNIRYIKLTFPQNISQYWNCNSLNSFGERYYRYIKLHEPMVMGSLSFDSTCTVMELKDSSATRAWYHMEQYATNTGLIYKINQDINFVNNGNDTTGTIYRETLNSFIR